MLKFRKKPIVIEAMKFDGSDECAHALKEAGCRVVCKTWFEDGHFRIKTLEGDMRLKPGDWVIKGIKGEFYPCDPLIFASSYERVIE